MVFCIERPILPNTSGLTARGNNRSSRLSTVVFYSPVLSRCFIYNPPIRHNLQWCRSRVPHSLVVIAPKEKPPGGFDHPGGSFEPSEKMFLALSGGTTISFTLDGHNKGADMLLRHITILALIILLVAQHSPYPSSRVWNTHNWESRISLWQSLPHVYLSVKRKMRCLSLFLAHPFQAVGATRLASPFTQARV